MKRVNQGVDRCVVYYGDSHDVWRGISKITPELDPRGEEITYVDGIKKTSQVSLTNFSATIYSYTFPEDLLDLYFGMSYRTFVDERKKAYEIHLVYNCKAELSTVPYMSLSEETTPVDFEIQIDTKEENITNLAYQPASHLVIRSDYIWPEALDAIESIIYGSPEIDPYLPSIDDVIEILESYTHLRIIDHGDGTWTAKELTENLGAINMVSPDEFVIDWFTARYLTEDTYKIHSG